MKQYEVLKWASLFLAEHNCEKKIADILLQHHLQVTASEFYMMMQEKISENIVNQYKADIIKHVETGIPVQHLTGYAYFYGRKFIVNKDVLIPRPETEELVKHVIELAQQSNRQKPLNIIDIGTGSGVIAITLSLELTNVNIYATDISHDALAVAKENAKDHHANISFFQGQFLQPIIEEEIKADIIVSNPPYIKESDKKGLSRTVKNFDPHLSLFAKEDGLAAYQRIIQEVPKVADPNSHVVFEIGYDQGNAVRQLFTDTFPLSDVRIIQDMNGKDRIVSAWL